MTEERRHTDESLRLEREAVDEALRCASAEAGLLRSMAKERAATDQTLQLERRCDDGAVATRDELLGIVSHDLRNMLNGIVGFANLIELDAHDDPSLKAFADHAARIQRSSARMARLIADLLDVSSIASGHLSVSRSPGNLAELVQEAVELHQPQARSLGITLGYGEMAATACACFDAARILQVLHNLLGNALKFTSAAGHITVGVERISDEVCTAVGDTGVGIPEGVLETIFDRFHQVAPGERAGAGLGLYICRCVVEAHGGRIWAESQPGAGSTFRFSLPVLRAAKEQSSGDGEVRSPGQRLPDEGGRPPAATPSE